MFTLFGEIKNGTFFYVPVLGNRTPFYEKINCRLAVDPNGNFDDIELNYGHAVETINVDKFVNVPIGATVEDIYGIRYVKINDTSAEECFEESTVSFEPQEYVIII